MREESSIVSTETARPVAAPGTRCLLLQLEPTPYILPRALYVYRDPGLHAELIFTYVNQSQHWGSDAEIGNIPVLLEPTVSKFRQWVRVAKLMRRILRVEFTVAHLAGWGHWVIRLAIFCCRLKGVPFSLESDTQLAKDLTTPRERLKRLVYPILFGWAEALIPGGKRQAALFRYYGVPDRKIFVSHMSPDTERLRRVAGPSPGELRASCGIPEGTVIALFVGRLVERKGLRDLLSALELVRAAAPDLGLVIIGDGALRDEVVAAVDRSPDRIWYLGRKNFNEVVSWMRASDFLVLPSHDEPWGLVVNEAMICGLPVVVSRESGCTDDLVVDGRNGLLFEAGEIDQLSVAMRTLASNSKARKSMGLESLKIIDSWCIERQAETIRAALVRMSEKS